MKDLDPFSSRKFAEYAIDTIAVALLMRLEDGQNLKVGDRSEAELPTHLQRPALLTKEFSVR